MSTIALASVPLTAAGAVSDQILGTGSGSSTVPVNTASPSITGIRTVGQTLTAVNGSWTNSPTSRTRQWEQDDDGVGAGTDISGANAQTLLVTSGMAGKYIRIGEIASNGSGAGTEAFSAYTALIAAALTIGGSPSTTGTVGSPYSFTPTVSGGRTPYAYSLASGTLPTGLSLNTSTGNISGSPSTAQTQSGIVLRVTDSDGLQANLASFSITISTAGAAPTNTALPVITGLLTQGSTLTVSNGTWSGSPTSYAYKWKNSGVDIPLATSSTYVIQASDAGDLITCDVTATNASGSTTASAVGVTPTTSIVNRMAVRLLGAGHNTGSGTSTSTGTADARHIALVNESGKAITIADLVFSGWFLTTTGTSPTGNTYPIQSMNIEYPAGTFNTVLAGGSATVTVPNGSDVVTDQVTLSTPIPAGATFWVNLSATVTSGQKYINQNLGLTGVRTRTANDSALRKEVVYGVGDSIMTNNGALVYSAASGKCPCFHASISGTTAVAYNGSGFARQVALAVILGVTRFISNYGGNDFNSVDYATTMTRLQNLRSQANAAGILFTQCPLLPQSNRTSVTAVTLTCAAKTATLTLSPSDAAKLVAGGAYLVSGATQTEYNVRFVPDTINTTTGVVTFTFPGSGTTTATGTITIAAHEWSSAALQVPKGGVWAAGATSDRGKINADIRGGAFDGFVEIADPCEPFRDSGLWITWELNPTNLPPSQKITVGTTIVSNKRFLSNYSRPANTGTFGMFTWTSGANTGYITQATSVGQPNGDIDLGTSQPATIVAGDQAWIYGISLSACSDGIHPRDYIGTVGGQLLILNPMKAFLDTILA